MEYKNIVINTQESISINDIRTIENEYKFKFPQEVVDYYLTYNGGKLERAYFTKNRNRYKLHYFYPIKYGRYTLEKKIKLTYGDSIPKWLIPIGCDEGGDSFCFSIKEGEEGGIYYVADEFYDGKNSKRGIRLLANNLTEFINGMVAEES